MILKTSFAVLWSFYLSWNANSIKLKTHTGHVNSILIRGIKAPAKTDYDESHRKYRSSLSSIQWIWSISLDDFEWKSSALKLLVAGAWTELHPARTSALLLWQCEAQTDGCNLPSSTLPVGLLIKRNSIWRQNRNLFLFLWRRKILQQYIYIYI